MSTQQKPVNGQPRVMATPHTAGSTRLVPALVDGARIQIDCPVDWCTVDHEASNPAFLADVYHSSNHIFLSAPVGGHTEDVMEAWITSYPFTHTPDPVFAFAATGDDTAELSATAALSFVDQFAAHLELMRAMAQTLAAVRPVEGERP